MTELHVSPLIMMQQKKSKYIEFHMMHTLDSVAKTACYWQRVKTLGLGLGGPN